MKTHNSSHAVEVSVSAHHPADNFEVFPISNDALLNNSQLCNSDCRLHAISKSRVVLLLNRST